MKLKLTNTTSKKEYIYDVTDKGDSSIFHHIRFKLMDMEEGEYEYQLIGDDNRMIFQKGLLRYGDYENENVSKYEPNSPKITQYMG